VLAIGFLLTGCSLALDFDKLQAGDEAEAIDTAQDEPTTPPKKACTTAAECNDQVDCTEDVCNPDGFCVNTPDHTACGEFEECLADQGCVHTGNECSIDEDCADAWDCTVDFCSNGKCGHTPHDDRCVDPTDLCMVDFTCDVVEGCIHGLPTTCDQPEGPSCYNIHCNPATGECDIQEMKPTADMDNDGYCDDDPIYGGDDCNDQADSGGAVNPGAAEVCNLTDDNCDTLVDGLATAGPAEITSADAISSPAVAFGGGRFVVAWQQGQDASATVQLQMLGTGACIADPQCEESEGALPASEVTDVTAKGGAGAAGAAPTIAASGEQLVVVWVATTAGVPSKIMALEMSVTAGALTLEQEAVEISAGDATSVYAPRVDWPQGADWVASWGAGFADGTHAIQVTHRANAAPFTGTPAANAIDSLSLACRATEDCVVAYAMPELGDLEVFEARVTRSGAAWAYADGWPRLASTASAEAGDISKDPSVAWTGDNSWVISMTDYAIPVGGQGLESDSDVRAAVAGEIESVKEDNDVDQVNASLVFNGTHFGLLSYTDTELGHRLEFHVLASDFSLLTDRWTAVDTYADGRLTAGPMILADESFATAWVASPDTGQDILRFVAFETCR
jgi:hypothetical protein